ncbi:MAG: hypothetical protein QNL90_21070, partial [Gammaproteobacteria bacterium]|nr:hypothetical protein [Gammaproteobacteria bacterium]MDX2462643.1 hypothetical protein [Gammaproteobacteria bacterium]
MPQVIEHLVSLSDYLLVHRTRNGHTARLSQLLNSRRQIYTIPVNVVTVMNNFTEVDADPKLEALFFRNGRILHRHLTLELKSSSYGCGDTFE